MKFPDVLIKYNYIYDLGFLFHWIQIKWKGFNIWPDDDGIEIKGIDDESRIIEKFNIWPDDDGIETPSEIPIPPKQNVQHLTGRQRDWAPDGDRD